MPLPPLKYTAAHGVLNLPVDKPTLRTEDVKSRLGQSLQGLYQGRAEQALPPEAPEEVPFLILPGRSSQIVFSQLQADIELEFHDHYETRGELCKTLVAERMERLLRAWGAVGGEPVWQGLVITLRASTDLAASHIFETHLRPDENSEGLHDAKVQLGLRLRDRYFVNLTIGQYEHRTITREVTGPGGPLGPIRPWEGEVTDRGLEVTVDINNRYGALVEKKHTVVDAEQMQAMNDLAWQIVEQVAKPYATDGVLNASAIEEAAV
jgi:hypothetical protein